MSNQTRRALCFGLLGGAALLAAGCTVHETRETVREVPAQQSPSVVYVPQQPPAPRVEPVPPPREGYTWQPGYWRWSAAESRYVWNEGRYVARPQPQSVWIEGRWEQRPEGWVYTPGRWS